MVVTVSGFLATFLIAVVIGADGLGRYAVVVAIGFYWLIIPANAIGMAMKKRMSENETPAAFLGGGLLLNGIVAATLAGGVLVAGETLGGVVSRDRELMIVLIELDVEIASLIVATIGYRTVQTALQGQKRVAATGWLKAGERLTRTGFQAGALLLGLGVAGITVGHVGALVLVTVAGIPLSRHLPSMPSWKQIYRLLGYAKYAWMGALRGRVFGWLDTLVMSFFVGASLIGIYEAAWGIASMLAVASASISQTLFPEVSDLSTDSGYDRIRHYLDEALAFSGIFVIPGLFGTAVLGERVLRFYRPEFGRGSVVLLILIAAYLADVFAVQFTNIINGIDRPDAAFRVNVVFISLNAVLNVLLVWTIGWYGAAIATAISSALRAIAGYLVLESILGEISIPVRELGRQVAAALAMVAAVVPVATLVPPGRLGTVFIAGLGAVVYSVVLLTIAPRIRSKVRSVSPVNV